MTPIAPFVPCAYPGCPALVSSGRCADHQLAERDRPNQAVRRWYRTMRWTRLRRRVLADAACTCAQCGIVMVDLEVDHITPHRGDPRCFWDHANLQALCATCHTRKTRKGV